MKTPMPRTIALLFSLALLTSCTRTSPRTSDALGSSSDPATAQAIADSYRKLTMRSNGYVPADGRTYDLCDSLALPSDEAVKKTHGPHAKRYNGFYMNDLAFKAFESKASYPVGSIIVKEKAHQVADTNTTLFDPEVVTETPHTVTGIGGMIKRAPGYDPKHGDWEYFYRSPTTPLESGRITSCVNCHRMAAKKDFVFGSWARQ